MKFKVVFIFALLLQLSCKQVKQKSVPVASKENENTALINEEYQKEVSKDGDLEMNSIINFSENLNTLHNWEFTIKMKQGSLRAMKRLSDDNFVFVIEEGDGNYKFSPFLLVLDEKGKQITRQNIKLASNVKYDLYTPIILPGNKGGFSLYFTAESTTGQKNNNLVQDKMEALLSQKQVLKLTMNDQYSGYEIQSKTMSALFLKSIRDKGFSNINISSFTLENMESNLVLYGTGSTANQIEIPFIIVFDTALNIKMINSFEGYSDTKIDKISEAENGNYFVEGTESTAADGSYYLTNKRFILDSDLKFIADKSDKEPYSAEYRGPSAPDYNDEDDSNTTAPPKAHETKNAPAREAKWERAIFYNEPNQNFFYSIAQKAINDNQILFEKSKTIDSTILWKIKFNFPDHYEVPFPNSTKGFLRTNGDFVFFVYLRDKNVTNEAMSVAIFVFNKDGRLERQFQTTPFFQVTDFEMAESGGKIITAFVANDAVLVNGDWQYPHTFKTMSFPL